MALHLWLEQAPQNDSAKTAFSVPIPEILDPPFHEDLFSKNTFFKNNVLQFSDDFKEAATITREGRMMNPDGSLRQRHVSQPVTQPGSESSWYEEENVRKRMERRQRERQVFCESYATNTLTCTHA